MRACTCRRRDCCTNGALGCCISSDLVQAHHPPSGIPATWTLATASTCITSWLSPPTTRQRTPSVSLPTLWTAASWPGSAVLGRAAPCSASESTPQHCELQHPAPFRSAYCFLFLYFHINPIAAAWFNGGPGCSSLEGLFAEHGQLLVNESDPSTLYVVSGYRRWKMMAIGG